MRSHKNSPQINLKAVIAVVVVIVVLLVLIFALKSNNSDESIDMLNASSDTDLSSDLSEDIIEEITEEVEIKEEIDEEGLCEDYFFEQGQKLKIEGQEIILRKIGSTSARISIDGDNYLLTGDDSIVSEEGLRVELIEGKLIYFEEDDVDNAITLRIGCTKGENANDKYVREKGDEVCRSLYKTCQEEFDLD